MFIVQLHLKDKKQKKEDSVRGQKRKAVKDEMHALKRKKQAVKADLRSRVCAAGEFAEKQSCITA